MLKKATALKVSNDTIARLVKIFKLLADESRMKILLTLAQDGEVHVSALCDMLDQSQPAVSHHLTLMRMVGLVGYDRTGKHNFYYLASEHVHDLVEQFFVDTGHDEQALEFDDFALTFSRRSGD